ncbi:hypothetical protein UACE39S_06291 [Ureibacillus acetophenoni]
MIHSLSGPSGSGKSTSALQFAHEQGIEAIIDDGILVIKGERVAVHQQNMREIRLRLFEEQFLKMKNIKKKFKKRLRNMTFSRY